MLARLFLPVAALLALLGPALAQDFPVIIQQARGPITIDEQPKRIVVVGWHEQDFLYALGVAPVAVTNWFRNYPYATWPWAEDARKAVGAEPAVADAANDVSLEWVLEQDPDLIIAIYLPLEDDLYAELSKIAPVVTTPDGYPDWGAPWQDELRVIDRAVFGNTDKAEAIIADLDARIEAAKRKYPEIVGKTASNVYYEPPNFTAWSSKDLGTRFLTDLGLVFPESLDAIADPDNRITISPEHFAMLDLDAVIWPIEGPDSQEQSIVEAMPLYRNSRMAKEGRAIWLDDGKGIAYGAMSFQTPLSLGYLIDTLPPLIAAAVDGDPSTQAQMQKAE